MGIDIVDVGRITRLVESRGTVFTQRWFMSEEVAQCRATPHPISALAARLAAKEAVWKSLGLDGNRAVPWRSIRVLDADGEACVSLSDEVAASAASVGVMRISVSTSTIDDTAMAVAMAWLTQ